MIKTKPARSTKHTKRIANAATSDLARVQGGAEIGTVKADGADMPVGSDYITK